MKITNKLNLPVSFQNLSVKEVKEYNQYKYSVTELLKPVREILLTRKYYNEIQRDVSDMIPAMFGSAVHKILEENTPIDDKVLAEQDISYTFDGVTINGRIDLLNLETLSIEDYKTCSVSKVTKEDFDDWKKQGLIYAWLVYKSQGLILRHLKFYAIMKDWSKVKMVNSSNYPSAPVYTWEYYINDSDYDTIETYIRGKIKLIMYHLGINTLPECNNEEKWNTGNKYAVYKKVGDKKASIVCDTEQEAHDYITNKCNGTGEIVIRKGDDLKCRLYCDVCKFCEKEGGKKC